jgi:hypothetical protein
MFMAIGQYGQTYHGLTHPRKDLLNKLCRKHAAKMYREDKEGHAHHVGYVIAGLWLTVYKVEPWEGRV